MLGGEKHSYREYADGVASSRSLPQMILSLMCQFSVKLIAVSCHFHHFMPTYLKIIVGVECNLDDE